MHASLVKIAWVLLCVLALSGTTGVATCGFDAADQEEAEQNPESATENEMMEDAIRDSER